MDTPLYLQVWAFLRGKAREMTPLALHCIGTCTSTVADFVEGQADGRSHAGGMTGDIKARAWLEMKQECSSAQAKKIRKWHICHAKESKARDKSRVFIIVGFILFQSLILLTSKPTKGRRWSSTHATQSSKAPAEKQMG